MGQDLKLKIGGQTLTIRRAYTYQSSTTKEDVVAQLNTYAGYSPTLDELHNSILPHIDSLVEELITIGRQSVIDELGEEGVEQIIE